MLLLSTWENPTRCKARKSGFNPECIFSLNTCYCISVGLGWFSNFQLRPIVLSRHKCDIKVLAAKQLSINTLIRILTRMLESNNTISSKRDKCLVNYR